MTGGAQCISEVSKHKWWKMKEKSMLVARFPCRTLSSLGNQFVNNLCGFLGRGGGVANVAVVNLPRVISTKLFTLAEVYNCVHTHHRYWTYISHSRVGIVSLTFQERHMCTLSDCDRIFRHQHIQLHTKQYQKPIINQFSLANKQPAPPAGNPWLAVGISPVCCPGFLWFVGIAVGIVGIAPGLLLVFLRFVALGLLVCCPGPRRKLQLARSSSVQMKGAGR